MFSKVCGREACCGDLRRRPLHDDLELRIAINDSARRTKYKGLRAFDAHLQEIEPTWRYRREAERFDRERNARRLPKLSQVGVGQPDDARVAKPAITPIERKLAISGSSCDVAHGRVA